MLTLLNFNKQNLGNVTINPQKEERNMTKKTEMIGFKTTPEIKRELEKIKEKEDRSISYIINRILSEHLQIKEEEEN